MNRRKFLGRFGLGFLAVPFGFKATKALTVKADIVPDHIVHFPSWQPIDKFSGLTHIVSIPTDKISAVDLLTSAPKAYGVTSKNFRPQLTPIKDIMRFTNHGENKGG